MSNLVVGKRVPIGAATTGLIMFLGDIWNTTPPDAALAMSAWGGLAATITAIVQIVVANLFGVTGVSDDQG